MQVFSFVSFCFVLWDRGDLFWPLSEGLLESPEMPQKGAYIDYAGLWPAGVTRYPDSYVKSSGEATVGKCKQLSKNALRSKES